MNLREKLKNTPTSSIFVAIVAVYTVAVVMVNIFEMKFIGTQTFAFAGGGIILSWAIFATMDIVTEVWGKQVAMKIFTFAAVVNIFIVLLAQLLIALPGTYPEQNEAFAQVMSNGPRIVIASAVAFWVGNYMNAHIMHIMKGRAKNKLHKGLFALRAIVSTIIGQAIDNALFLIVAFAPIGLSLFEMPFIDILTAALSGTGIEVAVEAVFVPITAILAQKLIRKIDNEKHAMLTATPDATINPK